MGEQLKDNDMLDSVIFSAPNFCQITGILELELYIICYT